VLTYADDLHRSLSTPYADPDTSCPLCMSRAPSVQCTTCPPTFPAHLNGSHSAQTCPECARTTLPLGTPHWHLCACELAIAEQIGKPNGLSEADIRSRGVLALWQGGGLWEQGNWWTTRTAAVNPRVTGSSTSGEEGQNPSRAVIATEHEARTAWFEDEEARRANEAMQLKLAEEESARSRG
jgi:hypothetical protein